MRLKCTSVYPLSFGAQAGATARNAGVLAAGLFVAALACAQGSANQPPPLPDWTQRPNEPPLPVDDKGLVSWPGIKRTLPADLRSPHEAVLRRWNPATGATGELPLGISGIPGGAAATSDGIVFVLAIGDGVATHETLHAVLFTTDGRIVRSAPLASPFDASWVVLSDGSAVLIGGRDGSKGSMVVERVALVGGELVVQRMPDLPGVPRRAHALVALADGRLMVLGGSTGPYRGCMPCQADTHILDPATKTWQLGPPMLQARSDHTATRLPDGSVLVADGWTPKEDWSAGPTRSTERWQPGTSVFTAGKPMVNGSAEHEALWMPAQPKPLLLMAGGTSTTVQAYAPDTGLWRAVGASARGGRGCVAVPFVRDGRAWLWRLNRTEPQYGPGRCDGGSNDGWVLTQLRLPGAPSESPVQSAPSWTSASQQDAGVMLDRHDSAFVPAQDQRPALVIGGTAGEDARTQSAAVDAISPGGVATPYPPLKHSRLGPKAVALANGVLVTGGFGGANNQPPHAAPPLPAEWLPNATAGSMPEWVELPGVPAYADALGADADGRGLVLIDRNVNRITVVSGPGAIAGANLEVLPPLNRARRAGNDESESVQIRGLADGRIVVAGGAVQPDKIALLQPHSDQAGKGDTYLGIGEFLPSRRHEIFDSAQRVWRDSAPSRAAGGPAAILDDGRVVKFAVITHPPTTDKTGREVQPMRWERVLEISSADGTRWLDLTDKLPHAVRPGQGRPFVVDGELLIATMGGIDIGGAFSLLLWLNTASGQWETLWEAKEGDNWRAHVGRHIARRLANGKRIVIPVKGF